MQSLEHRKTEKSVENIEKKEWMGKIGAGMGGLSGGQQIILYLSSIYTLCTLCTVGGIITVYCILYCTYNQHLQENFLAT